MVRAIAAFLLTLSTPAIACAHTNSTDNTEMAEIFAYDQAIRQEITPEKIKDQDFLLRMFKGDKERLARTEQLLAEGALSSANDFYNAAFIFQHGGDANSYLLAHTLAIAAVARGHEKATWIAAATLDRYLQEIGQDQIYGTQYTTPQGQATTLEPYNRDLVPDALRAVMGVPDQAAQNERLEEIRQRKMQ